MSALPEPSRSEITASFLIDLIAKPDPVILDIGCNSGQHTRWFLSLFENANVYSFEPDRRAIERYRRTIKDPRAALFELAIGNQDGFSDFYPSNGNPPAFEGSSMRFEDGWDLSGSIRKPANVTRVHSWLRFDAPVRVETKRLDTWYGEQELETIDLIWADVQGAEADLILGGHHMLKRTRFLFTEYSEKNLYEGQLDLEGLLSMLPDFQIICRYPFDILLANTMLRSKVF